MDCDFDGQRNKIANKAGHYHICKTKNLMKKLLVLFSFMFSLHTSNCFADSVLQSYTFQNRKILVELINTSELTKKIQINTDSYTYLDINQSHNGYINFYNTDKAEIKLPSKKTEIIQIYLLEPTVYFLDNIFPKQFKDEIKNELYSLSRFYSKYTIIQILIEGNNPSPIKVPIIQLNNQFFRYFNKKVDDYISNNVVNLPVKVISGETNEVLNSNIKIQAINTMNSKLMEELLVDNEQYQLLAGRFLKENNYISQDRQLLHLIEGQKYYLSISATNYQTFEFEFIANQKLKNLSIILNLIEEGTPSYHILSLE